MDAIFEFIRDLYVNRDDSKSKYDKDYYDVCIEFFKTLPYYAAAGKFFTNDEDEITYIASFGLIDSLANSGFKKNSEVIQTICAQLGSISVRTVAGTTHTLSDAISHISNFQNHDVVKFVPICALRTIYEAKTAICEILEMPEMHIKTNLINLFDRYILSLAITGEECVLASHRLAVNTNKRMPRPKMVVQLLSSDNFDMKTFLTASPITMFFGHINAFEHELKIVMRDLKDCAYSQCTRGLPLRHCWQGVMRGESSGTRLAIRNIQSFPRGKKAQRKLVMKMYPTEQLCMTHMFIRRI
jgi:hypothetical protein